MVDFANLTLTADTRGLKKGEDGLKRLADTGEKTERRVGKSMSGIKSSAGAAGRNIVKSMALAAGAFVSFGAAANAVGKAKAFNAALSETGTLVNGSAQEMAALEQAAHGLAREFGGNATAQVQAFYQAISGGSKDVAEANTIVAQANKLALGGATDVTTGVDALTTAIGAYGKEALSAQQASDALFVGMKGGKTTIAELSGALGNVIPLSAQLGISFDETVAAMSAITTQGKSTSEAATGIKAFMEAVIRAGDESSGAAKQAKELGLEFNSAALKSKGLQQFLVDMIAKTGGSKEAMLKLVGSSEALSAALALSGEGGVKFGDILDGMRDKLGATDDAAAIMAKGLSNRLDVATAAISDRFLMLGQSLLTVVVPAMEAVVVVFDAISAASDVLKAALIGIAAAALPNLARGAGVMVGKLALMVTSMGGLSAATGVLAGAMGILRTAISAAFGPIGLIVGAATGIASYFWLTRDSADAAAVGFDNVSEAGVRMNQTLENVVSGLAVTEESLRNISQTEALIRQEEQMRQYQASVEALGQSLIGIKDLSFGDMDAILGHALGDPIKMTQEEIDKLISKLDGIGVANPALRETVSNLIDAARQARGLGDGLDRSAALMRFLQGKATDADRAVLGIARSGRAAAASIGGIGNGFGPAIAKANALMAILGRTLNIAANIPGALGAAVKASQNAGGIIGGLIGKIQDNKVVQGAVARVKEMFTKASAGTLQQSDVFAAPVSVGGGGGGGGGAAAAQEEVNSIQEVMDALKEEISLVGQSEEARRLHQELQKAGVSIYSEEGQKISEMVSELTRLQETQENIKQANEQVKSSFESAFVGFVSGAMSAKQAAAQLLQQLAKILFHKAFQTLWGGIGGNAGGGLFAAIGSIFGRATGGPVQGGQPYLVNEDTPNSEVFVPSKSGAILNIPQAQRALRDSVPQSDQQPKIDLQPNFILELDADAVGDKWSTSPSGERAMRKQVAVLNNA